MDKGHVVEVPVAFKQAQSDAVLPLRMKVLLMGQISGDGRLRLDGLRVLRLSRDCLWTESLISHSVHKEVMP